MYYHCTSGKGKCEGLTYIREEKIETWVAEALSKIEIPEHIIEWTKQALMDSHSLERKHHEKQIKRLEVRYRTIKRNIGKAYEDKLGEVIDSEFWSLQNERLNKESMDVELQMGKLREASAAYIDKGVQLMELARNASTLFKSMTPDEKREMVSLVLSNLRIENGSLRYDYKKPFSMFCNVIEL